MEDKSGITYPQKQRIEKLPPNYPLADSQLLTIYPQKKLEKRDVENLSTPTKVALYAALRKRVESTYEREG